MTKPLPAKAPSESAVESRYILAPHQVNTHGTAFGGVIMSWIDLIAAMAGQRHCEGSVVTASIDKVSFRAPIHVGDHVLLRASVNYVGKTSMEIGVRVDREDPATGERIHTTTAYLTFVHLDRDEVPAQIRPLRPETPEEKRRYRNAKLRVQARKELLEKIKE
jgi:acyl-CoA hydrolase